MSSAKGHTIPLTKLKHLSRLEEIKWKFKQIDEGFAPVSHGR